MLEIDVEVGGVCRTCGRDQEWHPCGQCGGEGYTNDYDTDPLWYSREEDAWERCGLCDGEGGWWTCTQCHPRAWED